MSSRAAAVLVVALWAPYTLLNSLYPGPAVTYALGLLLALGAIAALGFVQPTPGARSGAPTGAPAGAVPGIAAAYLRFGRPSRGGLCGLAVLGAFVPLTLAAGRVGWWGWTEVLVSAPVSAIGQELYFRAALQPVLLRACRDRAAPAVALQALLFALWHVRALWSGPALWALAVLAGTFAAGAVWGWQVQRDRTVLYAAAQHTLFLAVQ